MAAKDKVSKKLCDARGNGVPGQALAGSAGVSGAAVRKAVRLLENDGYNIEGVPGRAFRPAEGSDVLSAAEIESAMTSGMKAFVYSELDSTNNAAKRMIADGLTDEAVIAADRQTMGRGRQGKSFFSPAGKGVYMTVVMHPHAQLNAAVSVTAAVAAAVCRVMERLYDIKPSVKWVNDIYIDERKLCGILTEAVSDFESGIVRSLVIGVGVNVNDSSFPGELKDTAVSLGMVKRNALIAALADEISSVCAAAAAGDRSFMQEYRERSFLTGREITFHKNGVTFDAVVLGIDDEGGLEVSLTDGTVQTLTSGEITVRRK